MIIEVAHITVTPGSGAEFEAAVTEAINVFRQAKGCRGLHLQKCTEAPDEYEVIIRWETLENHTIDFREGPLFQDWRGLVGGFFAKPPEVKHYEVVVPRADFT
ncbi:antibiotic biosynthesis monooxygenase family protein [Thalassovita sp.]|jgi:heme-degrading monooxygenase HmoA|uniref:antibiotic biosynthesis monooxygenase family protein n=1 Tax=Thalassovita sp. TaxID=1979401 RepID=UPI003B5A40E3